MPTWPNVSTGQAILASQFDDLSASIQAWRGDVSASGFALNDLAVAAFHQPANATWQEFRLRVSGASQAADAFALQYNSRSTSGGTDSWTNVFSVAVATGAVTFNQSVTFSGANAPLIASNNLSDLISASTARTNLGLGSAATQSSSSFDAAGAATAAVAGIPNADATHTGLLTSANWGTFNAKQSALTFGNFTEATSAVLTITGGTGAVIGSGLSIQVKVASGAQSGYLSSADWSTFNSKQAALGYTPEQVLTFSGPLARATNTISIVKATGAVDGYLAATDFAVFNSKQSALTLGNLTEATSTVLTVTGGTGAVVGAGLSIQVKAASGSQSGYLSSTDWTTFNSKQAALTLPLPIASGGTGATTFLLAGLPVLNAANTFTAAQTVTVGGFPTVLTGNAVQFSRASSNSYIDQLGLAGSLVFRTSTTAASDTTALTLSTTAITASLPATFNSAATFSTTSSFTGVATFTVAPVFTDQSGTRSALGLGSAATQASSAFDAAGAATAAVAAIPSASSSVRGLLTSADWTTFNGKQAALGYTPEQVLTFSGPLSRSVNTVSIVKATGSVDGYLAAADFTTFNGKQAALGYTPEQVLTFSGPLARAVNTISIVKATGSVDGYLAAADWTTFNGKQSALTLPLAIAQGGSGQITATAAFQALSPVTTLGDVIYGAAAGAPSRLAGNTSAVKQFMTQTGTGTVSAAPAWGAIVAGDVPTLNQNTAGTAANVTGVVALLNGGTGSTTASAARTALGLGTAAVANTAALTEATSSVLTITGGGSALVSAASIQVTKATGSVDGYLAAADFTVFAAKQAALTLPLAIAQGGTGQITAAAALTALGAASLVANTFTGGQTITLASAANGSTSIPFTINIGSDATLGPLGFKIVAVPSATGGSRWAGFSIGDGAAMRPLVLNTSGFGAFGNVLIGTTTDGGQKLQVTGTSLYTGVATFSVAPVFTDQSGTRTALGLGTAAVANTAALTEATSSILTITGGANALVAAASIQVKQAATGQSGYLSSTDWNTFNSKQAALTLPLSLANGGTGQTTAAAAVTALGAASLSTVNTFAAAQTFTVAPVFTDASGTRTALAVPGLAGANIFSGAHTVKISGADSIISVDTATASTYRAWVSFYDFGTLKWNVGKLIDQSFGIYDAVNARYSLNVTSAGVLAFNPVSTVFSTAVSFPTAANALLDFGGNWLSWTPSYTGSGSMTVGSITTYINHYLRIGPVCHLQLAFTVTPGGTPAGVINIGGIPIAPVGTGPVATAWNSTLAQPLYVGWNSSTSIYLQNVGGVAFTTGSAQILTINLTYRVA